MSSPTVGIISPAGASTLALLEQGVDVLRQAGCHPVFLPHAAEPAWGDLGVAGPDALRVADLHAAFEDPTIDWVLCARGGYGCMRLLPHIRWDVLARHPKPLIGFSDITALHMATLTHAPNVPCYYGPMLTSNLVEPAAAAWADTTLWPLLRQDVGVPWRVPNADTWTCLVPGTVTGRLMGGNLSLLSALCGSGHLPDFTGAILFLEDWREAPYRLDRKLTTLRLSGVLSKLAGLVLCDFSQIAPLPLEGLPTWFQTHLAELGIPMGYGFSVGHGDVTSTLPQGRRATFDAATGSLVVLEH